MLVATANILDRLDRDRASEALASVLDLGPDVVGLQEWGLADRGARPIRILPPRATTLMRLLDRANGSAPSVIDYHLVPGVQSRGAYRADRPLLVRRHRCETRRLGALVTRRLAADDVVIAMGDSNFDGFGLPGLVSAWAGRRDDPVGTLGSSRKVDDVFGTVAANAVLLVHTASDHAAVMAQRPD